MGPVEVLRGRGPGTLAAMRAELWQVALMWAASTMCRAGEVGGTQRSFDCNQAHNRMQFLVVDVFDGHNPGMRGFSRRHCHWTPRLLQTWFALSRITVFPSVLATEDSLTVCGTLTTRMKVDSLPPARTANFLVGCVWVRNNK